MKTTIILSLILIMNIIGILIMKVDKHRAIHKNRRIPEKRIWQIAICFGALGTMIGMNVFRHKTKHSTFKYGLPLLTLIQLCLSIWFLAL